MALHSSIFGDSRECNFLSASSRLVVLLTALEGGHFLKVVSIRKIVLVVPMSYVIGLNNLITVNTITYCHNHCMVYQKLYFWVLLFKNPHLFRDVEFDLSLSYVFLPNILWTYRCILTVIITILNTRTKWAYKIAEWTEYMGVNLLSWSWTLYNILTIDFYRKEYYDFGGTIVSHRFVQAQETSHWNGLLI